MLPVALLALLSSCGDRQVERPVVVDVMGRTAELADPLRHDEDATGQTVLNAMAQGLVSFDAKGEVVAALAESWIVADGGKSYIFRLRRADWANGEPVKAETVARLLQARMRASPDLLADLAPEVRAMTDRVIEIRLGTSVPAFIQLLAQPRLGILGEDGGTGPYTGDIRLSRLYLHPLRDAAEPGAEAELPDIAPRERRTLEAARPALTLARFQDGRADLVLGGRFQDLPLIPQARLATNEVRADPTPGLFGLAFVGKGDFLADRAVRDALARAVDRDRLAQALNLQGWTTAVTPLPAQLDLSREPTVPAWQDASMGERIGAARAAIDRWRSANGDPPVLRIALPAGAGANMLFYRLADDFRRIGLRIDRVPLNARADLRLVDEVAAFDSALWYLSRLDCGAGLACTDDASVYLELARSAGSAAEQASMLAEAERLIVEHAGFITLGMPIRWSLVSRRLSGFAPTPRAVHPLNRLL